MSPGVTHRAAASSHRDAGISCRSVNLARGAQEGKVIPPGSLQHPASQGARGTLAVLPAVGTGRGRDGSHKRGWDGGDLKDHPGQLLVPGRASQPELASTGLHGELVLPGDWGLCRAAGVTCCLQPMSENWDIFSCSGYGSF